MPDSMIDEGKLESVDLGGFGINRTEDVVFEAMSFDPDAQAKRKQLSSDTGVPEFAVEDNQSNLERDIAMSKIDFNKLALDNPSTDRLMSNVDDASVAHDDVNQLSSIENAMRGMKNLAIPNSLTPAETGQLLNEGRIDTVKPVERTFFEQITDPFQRGLAQSDVNFNAALESISAFAGLRDQRAKAAEVHGVGYTPELDSVIQHNKLVRAAEAFPIPADLQEGMSRISNARTFADAFDEMIANPHAMAEVALQSMGVSSTALAVGAATGGAGIATRIGAQAVTGFVIEYGNTISEVFADNKVNLDNATEFAAALRDEDMMSAAREKAVKRGIPIGLFNGITFGLAGSILAGAKPTAVSVGLRTAGELGLQAVGEGAGEAVAQAVTDEYKPGEILMEAFAGMLTAPAEVTANYIGGMRAAQETERYLASVPGRVATSQKTLSELNERASESKLKQRSRELFQRFAQDVGEDSDVYIDAAQASLYMQQFSAEEIKNDPLLTVISENLADPINQGADLTITAADFVTDMAGTEHFNALQEHMSIDADIPSPFRQEQAVTDQQNYLDNLMAEAQENASQYVEAQEIFTTVRDQLIDTGRVDSQQASALAQIVPAYVAVKSKEMGMSVADVYNQFGLTIEGPQTGKAAELRAAGVLKQAPAFSPDTVAVDASIADTGGVTLNPDGSVFTADTGYVATLRSINLDDAADINEVMADFAVENAPLLSRENVVIGAFDFGDGQRSVDINIVTQDRDEAVRIGTELDQDSIWDIAAEELIQTGGAGGVGLTLEEADAFLTQRDAPKQTADDFNDFFTAVTEGEEGKPSLKKDYEPVITTPVDPEFKASIDKHRGSFDLHIASSIPGHREVQDMVGAAIAETFKRGTILDIGASEGAMVKAIAETSDMTGVALDPNDAMEATFNKSKVKGAEYVNEAFGTNPAEDGTEAWPSTNWYDPKGKQFDVIHESMVFQFIHNDREAQISRVADLLKDDGVAIFEEKVFTDQWDTNEKKKNEYKGQYFNKADLTQKSAEVLEGMNENMVSQEELVKVLHKNFKYVTQYWDSGNFKGYAASNDNTKLNEFVTNIGDTTTEYTTGIIVKKSAAFEKWFGDSKVVDDLGNPLIVYHGTATDFKAFDPDRTIGGQYWFTTDRDSIESGEVGAEGRGVIKEVYLSIKNPAGWKEYNDLMLDELIGRGYDGITLPMGDGTTTYVALEPTQIKDVRNVGTFDPNTSNMLKQPIQVTDDVFRGTYDLENIVIRLNEASDLSTFLHEFAHFMLDMEQKTTGSQLIPIQNWVARNIEEVAKEATEVAGRGGSINHISTDNVREYLDNGTTGFDESDNQIEEAIHEQFARGFEAYIMEGKAPSMEMRNVFRTFARWLVQIYKSISRLNVTLDPEMHAVFDRLIATEEQIEMAEARAKFEPMFTDAAMAGMTEKQFETYKANIQKANDVAEETLRDKMIKQLTDQTKAWWKQEKSDMDTEERETLQNEPVYRARAALKADFKLDHAAVKAAYGEEKTNKLGRTSVVIPTALRGMTVKGGEGVAINDAAAFLGYNSGDEMVQDIIESPSLSEVAEQNAQARMIEKHGDILTDGTIEQMADEAIHNEEHGKQILTELKALTKGTTQATLDRRTIKFMAEERIGGLSFREINPGKYRSAEVRAAQESATALADGNKPLAAGAKSRQMMNHYLAVAANDAKTDIMKIVDRTSRYRKKSIRENIMKAGNGYMEQIDKILSRFEFRKAATLKEVDKVNQAIGEWARERMEVDGDGLMLDPAVLDETFITHWKNVKYSDLRGIGDSLKNMEHVARYSNKISLAEDELEFQEVVSRWTKHMNDQPTRFKSQRTDVARGRRWGRWAMAQMTKIPWMASWLDGGERAGMSHDILMNPLSVAYNEEVKLWGDVGSVVMDAIKNRDKETLKRHNTKVFIPEIKDAENDGNLMGHQILAVALNTGNAGNLKKMLLGEGWANPENEEEISFDNPQLHAVLAHMTANDWLLVQQIWDQMDILYPALAEVHKRTTGLTPPKVEATPLDVAGMALKGGYYPLKYDPQRSHKAEQDEAKAAAALESMFGGAMSIQASVNASSTSERTGYYAPIRLSLDVVQNHFQETIHYITHHDAVRQINKLIRNTSVADTIKSKLGEEEFAQLRPWLNDVAKDGREAPVKMFWDAAMQKLRFGTTLGIMGFKASTGLMQLLGLSNTAGEVGTANLVHALRTIIGSPDRMQSSWEFAVENSVVMNHRAQSMDREIRSAMTSLAGKKGLIAGIQGTSMKHIALIQTFMVDLPTWHAAYIKGMNDWGDEARAFKYADWAVENIQGSGLQKDMARIMRGQAETGRMFTMFMTFFSSLWNMERDLVKGARSGKYSVATVAAKAMFFFTVPVLIEMWMRGEFDIDEDDEDLRLQKMLLNVALYPVQSVPFVRDVANGLMSGYGYNMSPIAQLLEGGVKSAPQIVERMFTEEDITKGQLKSTSKLIGAALGVPGINQAWSTGEHLYDVIEEGEDLTARQLIYGPKR